MEHGSAEQRSRIMDMLISRLPRAAGGPNTSAVLSAAIAHGSDAEKALITAELIRAPECLDKLRQGRFGKEVVECLCTGTQHSEVKHILNQRRPSRRGKGLA